MPSDPDAEPAADAQDPGQGSPDGASIVLADSQPPGEYNPVMGYGELGVSLLYNGLLGLESEGDDALPTLRPALAQDLPTSNDDFTEWTVRLRPDVKFHDGSTLSADDVVATYEAVLDPAQASPISVTYELIDSVTAGSDDQGETVTFTLKESYADFATHMLLAIAPASALGEGPATDSGLNREPVGTGPYRLVSLEADRVEFEAFEDYWEGTPPISRITTVTVPDDNTRVQRVSSGDFDGSIIPPTMIDVFADNDEFETMSVTSADWRGVSFPRDHAFAADPQVRRAMNMAVDRQAMLDTVLAGQGEIAHTPLSSVYGDVFVAEATFDYDPAQAERILDEAGWQVGDDGIRTKDGERAAFTVVYSADDVVRRDLSTAFAADMEKIGIQIDLDGTDWDRIRARVPEVGVLLAGGDLPYSVDTQLYKTLHTELEGTSQLTNPGNYGSEEMDDLLNRARTEADEQARAEMQREVQRLYLDNPSYVFLAFYPHTYAVRKDEWDHGPLVVEPHSHGVQWGPWWNISQWQQ